MIRTFSFGGTKVAAASSDSAARDEPPLDPREVAYRASRAAWRRTYLRWVKGGRLALSVEVTP